MINFPEKKALEISDEINIKLNHKAEISNEINARIAYEKISKVEAIEKMKNEIFDNIKDIFSQEKEKDKIVERIMMGIDKKLDINRRLELIKRIIESDCFGVETKVVIIKKIACWEIGTKPLSVTTVDSLEDWEELDEIVSNSIYAEDFNEIVAMAEAIKKRALNCEKKDNIKLFVTKVTVYGLLSPNPFNATIINSDEEWNNFELEGQRG